MSDIIVSEIVSNIEIRKTNKVDINEIRNLWNLYDYQKLKQTGNFTNGVIVHYPATDTELEHMLESSDYIFFTAKIDSKIVGFIKYIVDKNYMKNFFNDISWKVNKEYFEKNLDKIGYLDQIVVSPAYSQKGVGRILEEQTGDILQENYSIFVGKILEQNIASLHLHLHTMKLKQIGEQIEHFDNQRLKWVVVSRGESNNFEKE